MNGNVDALKNLYAELGGDPAATENCLTTVEMLNAIARHLGGADNSIINPDAINAIAAVAGSIAGDTAALRRLIDGTITDLVIPDGSTKIMQYACYLRSNLESVVIPESVTSIEDYAFYGCAALKEIIIPGSVTKIGTAIGLAFSTCTALERVEMREGVQRLWSGCFYGCTALKEVVIPESVTSIGGSAFEGCSALESLVIPKSVTSIGRSAFAGVPGTIYCRFSEGTVSGAPWGATGTIVYDYNG